MDTNKLASYANFTIKTLYFNYSLFHNWDNELMPRPNDWKFQQTLYTILLMSILTLGILLNLLTIITISRGKHTGREVKIQLMNLAVADLLSAASLPISVTRQIKFPPSDLFCKLFTTFVRGIFTLWNMTISLERVVICYFPLKARRYRKKQKLMVATSVWCLGMMLNTESFLFAKSYHGTCVMVMTGISKAGMDVLHALTHGPNIIISSIIVGSYLLLGIKMCSKQRIGEGGTDRKELRTQHLVSPLFTQLREE